jgi:hypothetical protein
MQYDIFISYRRATGKNFARIIKPELEKRGFRVFLDFDELKDGVFDKRIMDAIEESTIFLMILSKGALDRCANEGDWVREEILYASEHDKHIVPVEVDKSFREIPEGVPQDVRNVLGAHQFSQVDTESLLEVSMEKLVRERICPHVKPNGDYNPDDKNRNAAEIHIDIDADCELRRFDKKFAMVYAYKDNVIYLKPGKHKLSFVSNDFEDIQETRTYEVTSENYSDILEVLLKKRIEERRKEIDEQNRQKELETQRRIAIENERKKKEEEKIKIEAEKKQKAEAVALRKRKRQESIRNFYLRLNSWLQGHCKLMILAVVVLLAIVLMTFLLPKMVSPTSDSEQIEETAITKENEIVDVPQSKIVKDSVIAISNAPEGRDHYNYSGSINLRSNLPEGHGVAQFDDGAIYEGNFKDGLCNDTAVAVLKFKDGTFYRGTFSKGYYVEGVFTYEDKSYYKGTYKVNKKKEVKKDTGTYFSSDGKELINYKNGESIIIK